MALPTPSWNGVELRWRGTMIDGSPAQGRLVITADAPRFLDETTSDATSIFTTPIIALIDSETGTASTVVPATDDPDITPNGFTYTVREELKKGAGKSITITAPRALAETGIDLNRAIAVGPAAGTPVAAPTRAEFDALASQTVLLDTLSVAFDDDGVPYWTTGRNYAGAKPVYMDEDFVPYIPAEDADPVELVGRGAPGGLAPLAGDGKIPDEFLPARLTEAALLAAFGDQVSPSVYRDAPAIKMITTFQTGHGWTANSGTWATDATDARLGSQSIKGTTAGAGTAITYRRLGLPATDLTEKNLAALIKVDQPTALNQVHLYVGHGNLANCYPLLAATGGISANATIQPGVWTWVYFSWADKGNAIGTPNPAAVTDYQVRVTDKGAGAVNVWLNAIGYYDKPTSFPQGVVSIAFDDNYDNQFTAARPAMDVYGYGGTCFTIVDTLGAAGYMTESQLFQLQESNGWEVAGHAFTMARHNAGFDTLPVAEVEEEELLPLRAWLKSRGAKGADLLAWPKGGDTAALNAAASRHFKMARQIVRSPLQLTHLDQPMRVRSYSLSNTDTLASVQAVVDRAYDEGAWLILTFHRIQSVADVSTAWPTADFAALMSYINSKGIPCMPVGRVLDKLS